MNRRGSDTIEGKPLPELWSESYEDLKRLARGRLRSAGHQTLLDTTGLVHEAFVRMMERGVGTLQAVERRQFYSYAASVMRSVIVDLAREQLADKRGAGAVLRLSDETNAQAPADDDPLHVDLALKVLREREPRLAQVVEMRFFGGFTEKEIAELLEVDERTVRRDWEKARVLMRMMLE